MIKELSTQIEGKGSVKGYTFNLIEKTPKSFIYEKRNDEFGYISYEVFECKEVNLFNFETKEVLEDKKVRYPKDNDFGIWAWNTKTLDQAKEISLKLNNL